VAPDTTQSAVEGNLSDSSARPWLRPESPERRRELVIPRFSVAAGVVVEEDIVRDLNLVISAVSPPACTKLELNFCAKYRLHVSYS